MTVLPLAFERLFARMASRVRLQVRGFGIHFAAANIWTGESFVVVQEMSFRGRILPAIVSMKIQREEAFKFLLTWECQFHAPDSPGPRNQLSGPFVSV